MRGVSGRVFRESAPKPLYVCMRYRRVYAVCDAVFTRALVCTFVNSVHSLDYRLRSLHCGVCSVDYAHYTVQCRLRSLQCGVCCVDYGHYTVVCAV